MFSKIDQSIFRPVAFDEQKQAQIYAWYIQNHQRFVQLPDSEEVRSRIALYADELVEAKGDLSLLSAEYKQILFDAFRLIENGSAIITAIAPSTSALLTRLNSQLVLGVDRIYMFFAPWEHLKVHGVNLICIGSQEESSISQLVQDSLNAGHEITHAVFLEWLRQNSVAISELDPEGDIHQIHQNNLYQVLSEVVTAMFEEEAVALLRRSDNSEVVEAAEAFAARMQEIIAIGQKSYQSILNLHSQQLPPEAISKMLTASPYTHYFIARQIAYQLVRARYNLNDNGQQIAEKIIEAIESQLGEHGYARSTQISIDPRHGSEYSRVIAAVCHYLGIVNPFKL